jgi:hypothetical protein
MIEWYAMDGKVQGGFLIMAAKRGQRNGDMQLQSFLNREQLGKRVDGGRERADVLGARIDKTLMMPGLVRGLRSCIYLRFEMMLGLLLELLWL